jgi:hypothetical protein
MDKVDVTGRDHLIICTALAYAIEVIERLPFERKEWSDQQDMVLLLQALSKNPKVFRDNAVWHLSSRKPQAQSRSQ